MEDEPIQSTSSMLPIALAILGIALGGAGLYFGIIANQGLADLNEKIEQWEQFYNFNRTHGAFKGKMPYETLMTKLKN